MLHGSSCGGKPGEMLQLCGCGIGHFLSDPASKSTHQAPGHCRAEEKSLPLPGQALQDASKLLLKGGLQQTVCLVQDQEAATSKARCQVGVAGHQVLQEIWA